jgi:hypothetical protein
MSFLRRKVRIYDKVRFRGPNVRIIKSSFGEVVAIEPESQKDPVELYLLFAVPNPGRR